MTGEAIVPDVIDAVVIHRVVGATFVGCEHAAGELEYIGDALGVDCMVIRHDGRWARTYDGDGTRNEDWFGWGEPLLAPFDGTVEAIRVNPVVNEPGRLGAPPASTIVFARRDGVHVIYAHVDDISVAVGDEVTAGQPVARIGNNGVAWNPHVHVGAWRGEEALQIRFDLHSSASEAP